MCSTCGCSDDTHTSFTGPHRESPAPVGGHQAHTHVHADGSTHSHQHGGEAQAQPVSAKAVRTLRLEAEVLAKNNRLADRNRRWLEARGITALNLMSAPGAGKTTLLERTIRDIGPDVSISVVEGDQATTLDSERIRATGCRVFRSHTATVPRSQPAANQWPSLEIARE